MLRTEKIRYKASCCFSAEVSSQILIIVVFTQYGGSESTYLILIQEEPFGSLDPDPWKRKKILDSLRHYVTKKKEQN